MAQLSSFAASAANVSVDAGLRRITISTEVVEVDGALDPPTGYDDWGGWTILCQSSGGLRSVAGASGTLGGGRQSLVLIEASNAHRFGGDNFTNTAARFSGDGTNVLKYHNIVWIVQTGTRSDFDIYRGSNTNGSQGCKVELSGVLVHQQTQSGQTAHFNHYSGRASIKVHPQVGFGLRIRNETNGPAIEFSTPIQGGAVVEGLVIDSVTATNNNGGSRCAVRLDPISANGTMTLSNLNTPSIAAVNGAANKNLLLIDPVGRPTRANWSNQYHGNFEIKRTIPFTFTGSAVPASTTMTAVAQTAGGVNSTASMGGSSGSIVVRTDYSANAASGGAWTAQNTYQFFMAGLGIRKYALTTTQTIANVPSTISAAITADALPDGSAIGTITSPTAQNPPDTLSELIRALKDWEVANPTFAPHAPLAWIDGNALKINTGYGIEIDANASTLIEIGPHLVYGHEVVVKCGSTMSASNGLTTLDASGSGRLVRVDGVTEDADVFLLDSAGQKSVVSVTNSLGGSALFSLVRLSDGVSLGSVTLANAATGSVSVSTKGLTTGYRLAAKRPGYLAYTQDVDLTGGGLTTFTAQPTTQIVQPTGAASYQATISVPATLTIALSSTGTTPSARVECGNATFTASQIFKAYEDALAGSAGAHYLAFLGQQMTYSISELKGNEIVLGAHTKIKRKSSANANAAVRSTLYAPDALPIDSTNGDVQTIEGLDIPAVAKAIITSTDFDPVEAGTQSVWGQLESIGTAVDGLSVGGGATAQQVWEYSGTRDLSTAPPTAAENATAVSEALTIPTASANATAVWGASARTLTSAAAPSAADVAAAVWAEIVDGGITSDLTITPI